MTAAVTAAVIGRQAKEAFLAAGGTLVEGRGFLAAAVHDDAVEVAR